MNGTGHIGQMPAPALGNLVHVRCVETEGGTEPISTGVQWATRASLVVQARETRRASLERTKREEEVRSLARPLRWGEQVRDRMDFTRELRASQGLTGIAPGGLGLPEVSSTGNKLDCIGVSAPWREAVGTEGKRRVPLRQRSGLRFLTKLRDSSAELSIPAAEANGPGAGAGIRSASEDSGGMGAGSRGFVPRYSISQRAIRDSISASIHWSTSWWSSFRKLATRFSRESSNDSSEVWEKAARKSSCGRTEPMTKPPWNVPPKGERESNGHRVSRK